MQVGTITVNGRQIGVMLQGESIDTSTPVLSSDTGRQFASLGAADGGVATGGADDGTVPHGSAVPHAHNPKRHGPRQEERHQEHHDDGGGQVHGGSYGGSGGGSGANYLGSRRAAEEGIGSKGLTTVDTKAGRITVNKDAAKDMSGAVNDLVDAGAPVGHIGSFADRNIAGSSRKSQHAYGGAMDLFDQTGRGVISKRGLDWIKSNPDKWREIKQRNNLVGGEDFGDIGHVEWGGPGYGERRYGGKAGAPSASVPTRPGGKTVKGSWFDDHVTATPGVSAASTPGIALPSREGLGKMYEVTGPNGKTVLLPQIDVGPAEWTGRGIDITGPAVPKFGYSKKNFPTDAKFTYKPVEEPKTTNSMSAPEDL